MRLALLPLNPTVGAIDGNASLALEALRGLSGVDLAALPELFLTGYPPRDLLWQSGFVEAAMGAAAEMARAAPAGMTVVVGCPWRVGRRGVSNALAVLRGGVVERVYRKRLLPTYDVFDEDRYFVPGEEPASIDVGGMSVGLSVCEDLWRGADAGALERYAGRPDPVEDLAALGVGMILNPSASPFVLGKRGVQEEILRRRCRERGVVVAAVNQLGGNDDLIFDGRASVYVPDAGEPHGARLVGVSEAFSGEALVVDLPAPGRVADAEAPEERALWRALTTGTRDYCRKTGFSRVILGVSGGIDSAVTACVAAAALGPGSVLGLAMPSRHSSAGSVEDARSLCAALGVRMELVAIEAAHGAMEGMLRPAFGRLGLPAAPDLTDENVQSRLRGAVVMAFSNKTGALALTTGNKSELAVGYCTLYGDMNGGLAVLADVTKAQVYRLARWINAHAGEAGFAAAPIPESSITKAPSAELRPNQTDQDSLPPYDQIDEVVERFVERRQGVAEIASESGIEAGTVSRIVRLIQGSEFKRKQAAVGLKVTSVAFGSGRRMPIAQGWRAG